MDDLQEAYLSVYKEINEASGTETPLQKIRRRNNEYFANNPETEQKTTQRRAEHKSVRGVKKQKGTKSAFGTMRHVGGPYKEEVETDLFDCILEYLISEGYANTEENAIAIMANMSKQWKEEIIEEYKDFPTAKVMKKAGDLMGSSAGKSDEKSKKKEKRGIKMMDTMMQHSPDR